MNTISSSPLRIIASGAPVFADPPEPQPATANPAAIASNPATVASRTFPPMTHPPIHRLIWMRRPYQRRRRVTPARPRPRLGGVTQRYVAAIDQGTTSSRCMVFDHGGTVIAADQREHRQIFPRP